jgi:hypothetical protein
MDQQWISSRIEAYKAEILACDKEIARIASSAQSYSTNTGQTSVSTTRANLSDLRLARANAEKQLQYYENLLCGSGTTHVVPGF